MKRKRYRQFPIYIAVANQINRYFLRSNYLKLIKAIVLKPSQHTGSGLYNNGLAFGNILALNQRPPFRSLGQGSADTLAGIGCASGRVIAKRTGNPLTGSPPLPIEKVNISIINCLEIHLSPFRNRRFIYFLLFILQCKLYKLTVNPTGLAEPMQPFQISCTDNGSAATCALDGYQLPSALHDARFKQSPERNGRFGIFRLPGSVLFCGVLPDPCGLPHDRHIHNSLCGVSVAVSSVCISGSRQPVAPDNCATIIPHIPESVKGKMICTIDNYVV